MRSFAPLRMMETGPTLGVTPYKGGSKLHKNEHKTFKNLLKNDNFALQRMLRTEGILGLPNIYLQNGK